MHGIRNDSFIKRVAQWTPLIMEVVLEADAMYLNSIAIANTVSVGILGKLGIKRHLKMVHLGYLKNNTNLYMDIIKPWKKSWWNMSANETLLR